MMKIAIIGGGAAGMMAAATLAEREAGAGFGGCEIFLLERNKELGKKVKISGGGRCNVTTGVDGVGNILKAYPRGAKFFRTALYNFSNQEVMTWFGEHGVQLKVEKDLRVFPCSNDGDDVVGVFENVFVERGVNVVFEAFVTEVKKVDGGFLVEMENRDALRVDKVVLTTGGQAYRHTGSTGDGYKLAENLGHSVTKLGPSLNSFLVEEEWARNLSGVSFPKVRLRMAEEEFTGPMLFTHKGVSGPAVFALSSLCAFEKISKDSPVKLRLDFCSDIDYEALNAKLRSLSTNQTLAKVMGPFVTKSFIREYCSAHDLDFEKQGAEVGKKDLNKAVEILKNTEVTIVGRLPGDEFVTAGGIELSEIDSTTMESKICPGLYFAGEIMNVDGFTGGYNLQVAWATGRAVGVGVS